MFPLQNAFFNKYPKKQPLYRFVPLDGAHVLIDDEKWLNFASHDYLGLSHHPDLKKSAMKYLLHEGLSPASTYLLYGELPCQDDLEEKLSALLEREAFLFCPSRVQAHYLLLSLLAQGPCCLFLPRSIDRTLQEAALLSGAPLIYYTDDLAMLLAKTPERIKIIVADFFFYTEKELKELAQASDALLYSDQTDIFGILGPKGIGFNEHPVENELIVIGFEAACASFGAFIATSKPIKEHLLALSSGSEGFTLCPPLIGAAVAAIEILPQLEGERRQLEQCGFWLKKQVQALGFTLLASPYHYLILSLRNAEETEELMLALEEERLLARADFKNFRVTFILTLQHTLEHLHHLMETLRVWSKVSAASFALTTQSLTDTPER
jgi:8-amino-7-oxononanoate synthase